MFIKVLINLHSLHTLNPEGLVNSYFRLSCFDVSSREACLANTGMRWVIVSKDQGTLDPKMESTTSFEEVYIPM